MPFIPSATTTYTVTSASAAILGTNSILTTPGNAITTDTQTAYNVVIRGGVFTDGNSGVAGTSSATSGQITVTDTGYILAGGSGTGISVSGMNVDVTNQGTVIGDNVGIAFNFGSTEIALNNTGFVQGSYLGVDVFGTDETVNNSGTISGSNGIGVFGDGHVIINSGLITGEDDGTFTGDGSGIVSFGAAGGSLTILNSGTIIGIRDSFSDDGNGVQTIVNSGTMIGDVVLGAGDDVYRATGDGSVNGNIRGGAGNDELRGGSAVDILIGGNGNDKMRGNEGADTLEGGNGRDIMLGGDGSDVIEGGNAGDLMLGGAGADEFLFTDTGDIGTTSATRDEIRDFQLGQDIINLAEMVGPEFIFLGVAGFTGSMAPELRLAEVAGSTFVQLDYDGDGTQDGRMLVRGVTGMFEDDFIL